MKLHWSPRSPFVRKVMIALKATGLEDGIELCRTVVSSVSRSPEAILADNPAGKIPALVLDNGLVLQDSRVILSWIDHASVGRLDPADPMERLGQMADEALADELTGAALLLRIEYQRDEPSEGMIDNLSTKLHRGLARFEARVAQLPQAKIARSSIALICLLGQIDLRFSQSRWREAFPGLRAWAEAMEQLPEVIATRIVDDAPPQRRDTSALLDFTADPPVGA